MSDDNLERKLFDKSNASNLSKGLKAKPSMFTIPLLDTFKCLRLSKFSPPRGFEIYLIVLKLRSNLTKYGRFQEDKVG